MVLATTLSLLALQADLPRRGALGAQFAQISDEAITAANLEPGTSGIVVTGVVPGLTAEKAGLKPSDVITKINDRPAKVQGLGEWVRTIPAGSEMTFTVIRDRKPMTLKHRLVERPRDPGNANYTVTYSSVDTTCGRMRTIITTPKKPGKYPAILFIQGFSPVSYDFTLEGSKGDVTSLDGPILYHFASSNFVLMRVEKPGVGDSEGGPFANLDFKSEIDIYRQAMKQMIDMTLVDKRNVFIFGHSMGGSFGPMIANEFPVRGLAVYGTAGRTWFEYLMDTIRYQGLVAGQSFEGADEEARIGAKVMSQVMLLKKSPEEVKKSSPELAQYVDAYFPGGMFNGKTLEFWRQLNEINFATYWAKCGSHVLAVRGASDFVTYDADHKLIADIINSVNPGYGKFEVLPNSDHLFHNFATEKESMAKFQFGQCNPAFGKLVTDWIETVKVR